MNKIKPKHIAWFIPIAYLLHLADEYFSVQGFHKWFSEIFRVSLSISDFLIINSFGFIITLIIVLLYNSGKVPHLIIASLGTLFFINGIVHICASIATARLSPGTISGLLIYLPLGYLVFKNILPLIPESKRYWPVIAGIFLQIVVAVIALNI